MSGTAWKIERFFFFGKVYSFVFFSIMFSLFSAQQRYPGYAYETLIKSAEPLGPTGTFPRWWASLCVSEAKKHEKWRVRAGMGISPTLALASETGWGLFR